MIRIASHASGVEGATLYEVVADGVCVDGPRVAVVGWVHGNEPVGGDTLDRLLERADGLTAGSVLALRVNLAARELRLRHTPQGSDINRMWDAASLAAIRARPAAERSYEESRALELTPLLRGCDVILDLHSATRPAPAFLIYRDDQRHAQLASGLGVHHLVTGLFHRGILDGGLTPDVGLCRGERSDRVGFTLEAGQHDDPTNVERAWLVVVRLLAQLGMWSGPVPAGEPGRAEVYEVVDRFRQAPRGTEPWRFVGHVGGEPAPGRSGPQRQLASFEEVEAGEVLLRRGRGGVQRPQAPFTMLLPTPHAAPGEDLYYVARRRQGGLGDVHRTDREARHEARAVERMLDVLDDDQFALGSSWVSFDPHHVLDVCAAMVARTLRMPPGHPHRRVAVVGRGDHGGDEQEQRHGRRYRDAMRRALVEGVTLERIQLLRGASLGWLDALTSRQMAGILALRREARWRDGETELGVDLLLSDQRPHSVSVLVVGDLDLALRTRDTRHVRVGLLIEAATVEPDGDGASIKVVRAGLFSARRPLLVAAWRFLRSLRAEHRVLVDHPILEDLPVHRLGVGGVIHPSERVEDLQRIRTALRRLQLHSWSEPLRRTVEPGPVEDPGPWIARTMARTGILDPTVVGALLHRVDGQILADPARLELVGASPPAVVPRSVPPAPLHASEVDADTLSRWLSWKRHLHTGQVVPDTRGRDIDLTLTTGALQRRLAAWFALARERASDGPSLVVVAGDGLNRDRDAAGSDPVWGSHAELLADASVTYLRIQHAAGAYLDWLHYLSRALAARGVGAPVGIQWEDQHGASVNVVLLATSAVEDPSPWRLSDWTIDHCGVVLADLEAGAVREYSVGLFTEPLDSGRVSQELLAFGRAHCEALLIHGGSRVVDAAGLRDLVLRQLSEWIARLRAWPRHALEPPPEDLDERGAWVAELIGLADPELAVALAVAVEGAVEPERAARAVWEAGLHAERDASIIAT